jgi:hypothetical protein
MPMRRRPTRSDDRLDDTGCTAATPVGEEHHAVDDEQAADDRSASTLRIAPNASRITDPSGMTWPDLVRPDRDQQRRADGEQRREA